MTVRGVHKITIVHEDGTEEERECPCDWCELWRAVWTPEAEARLDAMVLGPEVRPDWLGGSE